MRAIIVFISIVYFTSVRLCAQVDPILHSVYLIGDTGNDTIPSAALQLLAFEAFDDTNSTVVLLGDNIYPQGLNPQLSKTKTSIAQRKLIAQFELFDGYRGNFCVIPGNHDWSSGKASGKKAIEAQAMLTDEWFKAHSIVKNRETGVFATPPGLPGPKMLAVSNALNLVFLDSQWWLQHHFFEPVGKYPGLSRKATRAKALLRLDSMLSASATKGQFCMVMAHHPLYSNGKHVHVNEPMRSLINYTPLQIFGLLGLNRYFSQDLPQPRYRRYRRSVESILSKYPNTVYVAGHEHAMEYFEMDSLHVIISGSGSKRTELDRYRYPARFMDDLQNGFFRVTVHQSGKVLLHAFGIKDRGEYWKTELFSLPASR
ncbi:MAG: hypothetical protein RLZZ543_1150 [Bacteroidota bacterium]